MKVTWWGGFDDSDENSLNAQEMCVHEQVSGVCVYPCACVCLSSVLASACVCVCVWGSQVRLAAGGGPARREAMMRDCVGSWRLTQRVRGREGGGWVLERAARMVRQQWGVGRRQKGTGRGNRTTPVLSPGTAQPWAVITNHTSHFWGDISLLLDYWRGIRGDLKSQEE